MTADTTYHANKNRPNDVGCFQIKQEDFDPSYENNDTSQYDANLKIKQEKFDPESGYDPSPEMNRGLCDLNQGAIKQGELHGNDFDEKTRIKLEPFVIIHENKHQGVKMEPPLVCCQDHPFDPLIEDHRVGDQICSQCGLVVGDRYVVIII